MKNGKTQYSEVGSAYAKSAEVFEQEHKDMARAALYTELPDLTGSSVLDVGCGAGVDVAYYVSQGAEVMGIDAEPEMIDMARKEHPGIGDFNVCDLLDLDLPEQSVDIVTSRFMLQHLQDVEAGLRAIHRVLKPGGLSVNVIGHPLIAFMASKTKHYGEKEKVPVPLYEGVEVEDFSHAFQDYLTPWVLQHFDLLTFDEGPLDASVPRTHALGDHLPDYLLLTFRKHG